MRPRARAGRDPAGAAFEPMFWTATAAERRQADLFLADLLGEPIRSRFPRAWPPPAQEDWAEGGACFDDEEIQHTFRALIQLHEAAHKSWKEMQENPIVIEVQMIRELMNVLEMSRALPAKAWGEVWDELKAFASCDVKPLVARVKKGEKHANAVLRVLHGLTSILQGYVHDRIDATFKSRLESQKGWTKTVAKLLIRALKTQVPAIQREIDAGNFAAVATALEDLKKVVTEAGLSATGIWDVVVALGKEIIGNAIDDALKNTALWAAKQVGKKLLGSAAKAASVLFLIEEIALGLEAVYLTLTYRERLFAFNRALLRFVKRTRSVCKVVRPGPNRFWVGWKQAIARIDLRFIVFSFDANKGGDPGDGEWKQLALKGTFDGKTAETVRIDVPAGASLPGRRDLTFELPPVAQWPAQGVSFVGLAYATFDSAGNELQSKESAFVGACVTK